MNLAYFTTDFERRKKGRVERRNVEESWHLQKKYLEEELNGYTARWASM